MTDYLGPRRRDTDLDVLARSSDWITRRKPVVWLAVLALAALGFRFVTPREELRTINLRIDALEVQLRESKQDRAAIRAMLMPVLRGQCLDRPERETRLMGLDCNAILSPELHDQRPR